MGDHLSIRVWPSDCTSRGFSRAGNGPKGAPSGCPVRMILIIARTALTKNQTATIRKTTLIVPRTICNGPVMLFLPHTPGGVGSSHPPHGEGLIVAARRRPPRRGPVRGSHAGAGARTAGTIAGARSGYSPVTPLPGAWRRLSEVARLTPPPPPFRAAHDQVT